MRWGRSSWNGLPGQTFSATSTGTSCGGAADGGDSTSAAPKIQLSRGALFSGTQNYWYSVSLSGFKPNSTITLACNDSVDRSFYTEQVRISASGTYTDSKLCRSPDGPDHWVTAGSTRSNTVKWGPVPPLLTALPSLTFAITRTRRSQLPGSPPHRSQDRPAGLYSGSRTTARQPGLGPVPTRSGSERRTRRTGPTAPCDHQAGRPRHAQQV